MMKKYLIVFSVLLLLEACAANKQLFNSNGDKESIIQNAILDFISKKRPNKNDSVFHVNFYNTLPIMMLDTLKNGNLAWVAGEPYKNIIAVTISGVNGYRLLLTKQSKVGSKGILPSRTFKANGKLFYWWDDDYPLTEETITTLKQYNVLKDDEGGVIKFLDGRTDDSKKAVHYYFCRHNLSNYKRIVTWKGIGYYEPPSQICKD